MKRLPKGFGSVQKMTGSRRKPYGARIWDAKHARHFYIGYYETMEAALAALHEYHKSPYEYDKKDMTLKDCLNILLRQRVNVSESTQKNYEYKLNALGDIAFQNVRFISPGVLEKWIDTSNYSPYTKRQYLSYVKQLLDIAVDEGIISKNPASKVALKKEDEEKIHKPISFLDLKKLWDDKENNIAQLILIMCYTGMRPGELLQIKKENIFLDEKGNLHIKMYDTYDFNKNEESKLIRAGASQMEKGALKPFFTIHDIIIPKDILDEIWK